MANLPESAKWETGIYQLEEDDFVLGGVDGVDNKPLKQLANRTKYLKDEQDKLKTATAAATTAKTGTTMLSNSTTGTSQAKAATELAAKTAMDRANAAYNLANGKANASHTHPMSQITDLAAAMGLKANLASPAFSGAPTAPTAAQTVNNTQIATTAFVKTALAQLVGSAVGTLDTLQEIGAALGNDPNLRTTLLNEIGKKATKATTLAGYGIADFIFKVLTTEDLDGVKVAGFYAQGGNANATAARHYPEVKAGSLTVRPSTYGWQQEYVIFDNGRTYIRNMQSGGAWSPWWRIDSLDHVGNGRTLIAGNGLTGGGNLGANRTFALGTPSPITAASTNSVGAETHSHAVDKATTSAAGIVQLSSSTTGTSEAKAATEKAVGDLNRTKANLSSPTFTGIPKAPTPAKTVNDTTIATTAYVKQLLADLVDGAPAQLDTLKEIATVLGNKANLEASLLAEIAKKSNTADVVLKTMFIGVPIPYPSSTIPTGFLAMTGQTISQTTYPRLYALYGAKLPDLRGEFIRGWDNGRNVDRGRAILTAQGHLIQRHEVVFPSLDVGGFEGVRGLINVIGENVVYSRQTETWKTLQSGVAPTLSDAHRITLNNVQEGDALYDSSTKISFGSGNDTRPRNIAFNYICLAG